MFVGKDVGIHEAPLQTSCWCNGVIGLELGQLTEEQSK